MRSASRDDFAADQDDLFSLPSEFVRQEVARHLTVAGEHFPTLKKLLSYKGEKLANLPPATLSEFLTRGQQDIQDRAGQNGNGAPVAQRGHL